ncbi:dehydrogenase [Arthrobacter livingstonensis]|uniref:Dehydrogenase n=1 Tax=Arthrobacter livingstonensis TaxID=670078 RepID=A0A2V5LUA5_9MICC|nr:NAD(P)-dependent oxidoreductase [Arthrobacter livingstonensis]PYI65486.1 dehydrogenase [Arthrobacter livingstonensis]
MKKRVFVAGASGAIGRRLLPLLVAAGFEVTGTTTTPAKIATIEAAGARGIVLDGLDLASVGRAVSEAHPDVVIHELTSLAAMGGNPRKFGQDFATTNRLRTEGTDHLLAAAVAAGAQRFIAQSYTGWPNEPTGSLIKVETDPLDPTPAAASLKTVEAIRYLENAVTHTAGIDGMALRYGSLYGPGTGLGKGGGLLEMVAGRRFPLVAGGAGVWSFCDVDDAAAATVAAVTHGKPGIYNIVDDQPAPVSRWLPYLAESIGAKPPMRLPAWIAGPLVGDMGMSMITRIRGSSNAKAREELAWQPSYSSWRQGFESGLE